MAGFAAKRLPKQPGRSGWEAILSARTPSATLNGARTADIAIIGAGFAGLSAARRIGQLDPLATVAVLEAGEVGQGPAGRNSGFMIDLPHDLSSDDYAGKGPDDDRRAIANNRVAIGFARELAAETQMPRRVFDPAGKINAAATEAGDAHNRAFRDYLLTLGEESRMLDALEMRDLTGTGFYTSGLHTPGAVMIQPAAYIRGLADALGRSVTLFENSPVLKISREGGTWCVETHGGAVTARRVILATNGHAESFGFYRRRLMHVFTYASMTRALNGQEVRTLGGAPDWSVTPADPMGATVRRISGQGGDRIVVRARFTYDPSMEVSDDRVKSVGAIHDTKFRDRFPMLSGVGMEFRWAGHLCLSWNGVPAFGEVDDGVISAVCQNGLGTVQGTLAGMAAAETALECHGDAAAAFTGHPAPRKLPPEPLAWIGANATLRWKEWRAGSE
ncbi:MAG: FAD-binding oxidoreductase [Pseudomonadota bacterium]